MKTIKLTVAHSTLGKGSYESPVVKVAEFNAEGVLCASSELSVEEWETGEFEW